MTIFEKVYIIFKLPYSIIIRIDLLKLNNVNIRWGDLDFVILNDKKILIKAISGFLKIKAKILKDLPILVLLIKIKIIRIPYYKKVNIYIT